MASSSPSRDQSANDKVSGDVPSESHGICKTEIPIRTFNNLTRIDPSIPYPINGCLDLVRDNFWREPSEVRMSICTCSDEVTSSSSLRHVYFLLAKKALAYYNAKEKVNLSFVRLHNATYQPGSDKVHMSFFASSEEGGKNVKALFAELLHGCIQKLVQASDDLPHLLDEYHVQGCCLLEKIDSGNPFGWGCALCGNKIIHPGPRHGYMIVGGDSLEGYHFWGYRPPLSICEPTTDEQEMYLTCAMKALEYFNSTQFTQFGDLEVGIGSFSIPCAHKTIIHVNFKCFSPIVHGQQLFFAELVVPTFATIDNGIWDVPKEPFIEVKGCCTLERCHVLTGGLPFGRACDVCYCNEVIHPSPKDGHRLLAGDAFKGYGFMDIGTRIY